MQTILGSTGQIGEELARELFRNYTKDIRLVSRNPRKVNESDALFPADLTDPAAADAAVAGSDIVYFTVGLPMVSQIWEEQFPLILSNVINACAVHQAKLVFFDNTYMYPKTSDLQSEGSSFVTKGRKTAVRAQMARMMLDAMKQKRIEAVICRAPEFYGPGKTQGITNSLIFNAIRKNKLLRVPVADDVKRSLIFSVDASRATALIGNTPDAYMRTWHLPCDDNRLTYRELIELSMRIWGRKLEYKVVKLWEFRLSSLRNPRIRELMELLPRYKRDNLFSSDEFKKRFPDFRVTPIEEGITLIKNEER